MKPRLGTWKDDDGLVLEGARKTEEPLELVRGVRTCGVLGVLERGAIADWLERRAGVDWRDCAGARYDGRWCTRSRLNCRSIGDDVDERRVTAVLPRPVAGWLVRAAVGVLTREAERATRGSEVVRVDGRSATCPWRPYAVC